MFIPRKEAFWLGQYAIHWYGLIIASSVLIAIIIADKESRRLHLPQDTIIDFALIGVPIATIFARLYYVAFEWEMFADNPWRILAIWEGGIAMYGSLIGGAIAAIIVIRWKKTSFAPLADAIAPGLVLAQAIGRWGNFTNQEAYGPMVINPNAHWFPLSVYIERTGQWHMATFFYESMWCLAVFLVLWFYVRKRVCTGQTFAFYLLLYGGGRAIIEGLRTDSLYLGVVRVSQFGSVMLMLCVCVYFFIQRQGRGAARKIDIFALGFAVFAAAAGIISQNFSDSAWVVWPSTVFASAGLIAAGWLIWLPFLGGEAQKQFDPVGVIEKAEDLIKTVENKPDRKD